MNAVKFSFDGSEYRSTLDRGPEELAILAAHGHEIQGMSLQSYIFFGSANRLYEQVKALFARNPETRFLLFDFRLVTGIDSSAMHSFTQIKRAADELGARLVLVNLSPELNDAFRNRNFITDDVILADDLDRALEYLRERRSLRRIRPEAATAGTLRDWLDPGARQRRLCRATVAALRAARSRQGRGHRRARRARPLHAFHPRRPGRHHRQHGRRARIRVRSLGPHTTIGEMGLITRQMRSATIQAEVPSVLYELSADAYERLKQENSALAQALLTYIVRVMAERLSFASKVIGVLRR